MKVILFANTDWYLYNYRLPLAEMLRQRGFEVVLLSPPGKYGTWLQQRGFRWIPFPLSRRGQNPLTELAAIWRLLALLHREKPDVLHNFTIKCVIYGSLAARLSGVKKIINAIPGLGYVFTGQEQKPAPVNRDENRQQPFSPPSKTLKLFETFEISKAKRLVLRLIVELLYKVALHNTSVIFQNPDDQAYFLSRALVRPQRQCLIRGSGVDLDAFPSLPEPPGVPVAILAARMLWAKGVAEFVAAARTLQSEGLPARFALVGDADPGYAGAIPRAQLEAWQREGAVELWGWHDDMLKIYRKAHIVCLPSYYGEGVPRALVEAAACGRPVIGTDMPGCREIVRPAQNGILVPPHDAPALAAALRRLAEDASLRLQMGQRGRQIVAGEFSLQIVLSETLKVYGI